MRKKTSKYILVVVILLFASMAIPRFTAAQELDGKKALIEEYVKKSVINSVMDMTGKTIQRLIKSNNIGLFPVVASNAIQQATMEIFKQESTNNVVRDAYRITLDKALEQFDQNIPQESVQKNIRDSIDEVLRKIPDEPIYKRIIEETVKNAVTQQHKVMAMAAAQQQVQIAAMQKQYQMAQMAMMQQYQQEIIKRYAQEQAYQQQQAVQSQYNQMMQGEYERRMLEEYQDRAYSQTPWK